MDVRRHGDDELAGGRLRGFHGVTHAPGRVDREHDLDLVGRVLRVGRAADQGTGQPGHKERDEEQPPLHRDHMSGAPNSPAGTVTPRSASLSTSSGRMPVDARRVAW